MAPVRSIRQVVGKVDVATSLTSALWHLLSLFPSCCAKDVANTTFSYTVCDNYFLAYGPSRSAKAKRNFWSKKKKDSIILRSHRFATLPPHLRRKSLFSRASTRFRPGKVEFFRTIVTVRLSACVLLGHKIHHSLFRDPGMRERRC